MKRMARIILSIHDLATGGSERAVATLAHLLAERSHEVTLVLTKPDPSYALRPLCGPDVRLVSQPMHGFFDMCGILSLRKLVRRLRPDAVLSASLPSSVAFKMLKGLGVRFPLYVREGNVFERHGFRSRLFDRLSAFLVAGYIVNANAIKDDLVRRLGIRAEKINVVYNGLDTARFAPDGEVRQRMRAELGVSEQTPVVIHVGSMGNDQKGQDVLIDAWEQLPEGTDAVLVFIGAGSRRSVLQARAEPLGDRVRFLGERSDIPDLLRAADVCAFPSRWEGMPNAVLEAMAAGLPVVATPVGGIPEILSDHESGLLVPAGEVSALTAALKRLIEDASLRVRLGRRGRQIVSGKRFTRESFADAMERYIVPWNSRLGYGTVIAAGRQLMPEFEKKVAHLPYEAKGILFSEILFLKACLGDVPARRILESGRARGQSTLLLSRVLPDAHIISVEFDRTSPDVPVAEARLKDERNITLLYGDARKILPERIEPGDVVVIDGPKMFLATRLALRLLATGKPRAVFIHDTPVGTPERSFLERFLPEARFSDNRGFAELAAPLDENAVRAGSRHTRLNDVSGEFGYGFTLAFIPQLPGRKYRTLIPISYIYDALSRPQEIVVRLLRKAGLKM